MQSSPLLTEEEGFHDLLKDYLEHNGMNSVDSLEVFSHLTTQYTNFIDQRYKDLKKQYDRQEMTRIMNVNNTFHQTLGLNGRKEDVISFQLLNDYKAERDFWSLLQYLSSADLLHNLREELSKDHLEKSLNELSIHATIPEYINTAYQADERLKKGAILTEWLENCASDEILSIPRPLNQPWSETWYHVTHQKASSKSQISGTTTTIKSLDPDAQIRKDGKVLPLSSNDQIDQERLWKAIWKLIRAGKLPEAQQLAADHQVFWFASALRGGEYHYYEETSSNEEDNNNNQNNKQPFRRIGNPKQPYWLEICWKYSEHLANNSENWKMNQTTMNNLSKDILSSSSALIASSSSTSSSSSDLNPASVTGITEMTIFASLSNNLDILLKSPLLSSSSSINDRLWIYLKAIHCHNLMLIVNQYRKVKYQSSSAASSSYLACDVKTIEQEEKMISLLEISLQTILSNHNIHEIAFIDNYSELLMKVLNQPKIQYLYQHTPSSSSSEYITLDILLIHFQLAVIEGKDGLQRFLQYLSSSSSDILSSFIRLDQSHVLRIITHFLIWSKVFGNTLDASTDTANNQFASVIPMSFYYQTIESYLQTLIKKKLFHLVPLYHCFLDSFRAIENSSKLFLVLQKLYLTTLRAEEGAKRGKSNEGDDDQHPTAYREIFLLCHQYFPQYTIEIIRRVLQMLYEENENSVLSSLSDLFPTDNEKEPVNKVAGLLLEESAIANTSSHDQSSFLSKLSFPSGSGVNPFAVSRTNKSPPVIRTQQQRFGSSVQGKSLFTSPTFNFAPSSMEETQNNSLDTPHIRLLMETLYWLSLDKEYSLELLKQTNRMILYFFSLSSSSSSSSSITSLTQLLPPQIDQLIQQYIPIHLLQHGNQLQKGNFIKLQQYLITLTNEFQQTIFTSSNEEYNYLTIKQDEINQLISIIFLEYDYWILNQFKLLFYHLLILLQQYEVEEYYKYYSIIEEKRLLVVNNKSPSHSSVHQLSLQTDLLTFIRASKEYLRMIEQLILLEKNDEVMKLNIEQQEEEGSILQGNNESGNDISGAATWKKKVLLLAKPFLSKTVSTVKQTTSSATSSPSSEAKEEIILGKKKDENIIIYGYYDLFRNSNSLSLQFILSLFKTVIKIFEQGSSYPVGEYSEGEVDNAVIISSIESKVNALDTDITGLTSFTFHEHKSLVEKVVAQFAAVKEYLQSSSSLLSMLSEDQLLSIQSQLSEISSYCQDIKREAQLKETLLFHLLQRYVQVSSIDFTVLSRVIILPFA